MSPGCVCAYDSYDASPPYECRARLGVGAYVCDGGALPCDHFVFPIPRSWLCLVHDLEVP